jgi:predicted MFS family arabinose efflux permease
MTIPGMPRRHRLRFQLLAITGTRGILNTSFRMIYPFLPVFARGLGVSLETMALAVTARSLLGLAAPAIGSLADVRGRKWTMLLGLALFSGGLFLVTIRPTYAFVFAALVVSMAGKLLFDPAMQAYIGDQVAYTQRGLAIAITEFGWSAAGLVGLPLVGWLIASTNWSVPFPVLAFLGLTGLVVLWRLLPPDTESPGRPRGLLNGLALVATHTPAVAGLLVSLISTVANESVNIVYGVWLEDAFHLQVVALGVASTVIGLAELSGEGLVAAISDRLGKRKMMGFFIFANALSCLAIPRLGTSIPGALVSLFFFYITFEIVIVASISLMTEILPSARATVMAANVAALSLGRAIGAPLGPRLFHQGMGGNVALSAGLDVLALIILITFVKIDESPLPRKADS